ncbi:inosine/xanthosine triphosphatase [Pyrobaculum oguniense TE7]|uniref:Probable inosine/xanthosine triphosphatase n=1 Tax=Pyrobaculum oguniense (strain DSM 13380 / JCM 10595 / TE7) TaxID=698757 RepID=H6QAL3_PYROT|nr:inosine/xanthosine triphosphatase [Pyrobaculum oguniense TE7]
MIVAVGTKNPNKIRAVKDAYRLFGFPAEVVPVGRPAGTPPQPVGLEEVVKGAVARAKAALEAVPGAEHGVGVEAGAVQAGGAHLDITVAAVADRSGAVTLGFGPAFQIPTAFLPDVLKGVELGELAERYFKKPSVGYREGIIGVLTGRRVTRYQLNLAAVAMALVPRLPKNAKLYRT